ncbi:MAG: glycosyltransferase family 39 protein, partial [Pyrinomonadaceae bacterium]
CWLLARDITGSLRTSTLAALLITLSPTFVLYSGQAMTEIPGLLLLVAGLVVHLRGLRRRKTWLILTGAAMLGLNVNIREALGIYGLWLIIAPYFCGWRDWHLTRRDVLITAAACLVFMICALAPFALWFALNIDNYRAVWYVWLNSVRMEGSRHPVRLSYLFPLLYYFFTAAPITLLIFPFAAYREYKTSKLSLLLVFGLFGFVANMSFFFMYSTAISGRYLLTGLPVMAPLIANHVLRAGTCLTGSINRAFTVATISIVIFMMLVGREFYRYATPVMYGHVHTRDYYAQRLALLPRNALILAAGQTVSINYYRGLGMGEWDTIGTGGGWPGSEEKVMEIINRALRDGRRVFIDTDQRWWATRGWKVEETEAIVDLENHYRFRRTTPSVYEIRPLDDASANDHPNLKILLEEQ